MVNPSHMYLMVATSSGFEQESMRRTKQVRKLSASSDELVSSDDDNNDADDADAEGEMKVSK